MKYIPLIMLLLAPTTRLDAMNANNPSNNIIADEAVARVWKSALQENFPSLFHDLSLEDGLTEYKRTLYQQDPKLACDIISLVAGAMNANNPSNKLTADEIVAWVWKSALQEKLPPFFHNLSPEDHAIYERTLYHQDPEKVTASRMHFIEAFYATAEPERKPGDPWHDMEILKSAILKITRTWDAKAIDKPTDSLSAQIYVFYSKLNDEERDIQTQANYLKNPKAVKTVAEKWSRLVVDELVKLSLVESTHDAKAKEAKKLYDMKLEAFEKGLIGKEKRARQS